MSELRIVIRDAQRSLYANRHGSLADSLIAALSADPDTIDELDMALRRFVAPGPQSNFHGFSRGIDATPHDAGLVIIDLAARLVVCDSVWSAATPEGRILYHDGNSATEFSVPYHLADDWLLQNHANGWENAAEQRRRERSIQIPLDVRAVLYGQPLLEFIAMQCLKSPMPWP